MREAWTEWFRVQQPRLRKVHIAGASKFIDVREATADAGPLADYLRAEHWSRTFTYAWRRSFAAFPVAWRGVAPAADFDVLVYVPPGRGDAPMKKRVRLQHPPARGEALARADGSEFRVGGRSGVRSSRGH